MRAAEIGRAAALLRQGDLVAFPTETVYGLGADATSKEAIARLYQVKGRPAHNPLIVHFASAEAAFAEVEADARAQQLAAAFWPGPLTLVLPRRPTSRVVAAVTAGLDSMAVRVPAAPAAHALLAAAGIPVAAPSANRSGRISPTTAADVAADLGGQVAMILDDGPCRIGVESTVVGLLDGAALLRPGAVTAEEIEALIGPLQQPGEGQPLRSPGMLSRHYAPATPVRLNADRVAADEALLAFGRPLPGGLATRNLSPSGDLAEAAAHLYAHLHALDRVGAQRIAVMPVPETGLGRAINDRLRRAAAPC